MSTVKAVNYQIGQSVTATNNFTLYQPASPDGTVRLGNGNSGSVTDLVTLTSAGNLGIGTSSPGAKLDVNYTGSPSNNSEIARLRWNTSGAVAGNSGDINFTNSSAVVIGKISNLLDSAGTALGFWSYSNAAGTAAEKMRLDSSGNLGLGVTPSAWATLKAMDIGTFTGVAGGNGYAYFSGNAYLSTYPSTWTYKDTNLATLYTQVNGQHIWKTAPSGTAGNAISFTQAMTLDASGCLLVGLTASVGSAYTLQVKGAFNFTDSAGNQVCFYNPSNGFMYMAPVYNKTTASAANVFVGSAPGDMYRSTSALKYKQDIRDLESIDINKFRPVRYRSKCENDDQSKDHFGIIADEALEAGFPELVIFGADGEPEGFQYERLTAVLVKAVQDLSAELNELKQKVNA